MRPVKWGVLSTAKIGLERVLPPMMKTELCEVYAIASRNIETARTAAARLGIRKTYGSYEELLADPEIEAVYNPLPNHMHVEWTKKAAEAGKHVLCEKPIALTAAEATTLLDVRNRTGVLIQEAFMVRDHPQWLRVRELIRAGRIGPLRLFQMSLCYMNMDPANIRNIAAAGGGGLYDIGCYPVVLARFLFEAEPRRVVALVERDPSFGTDRLASAILDFPQGQAVFSVATQVARFQVTQALGPEGRIEVDIPVNAPSFQETRIWVAPGRVPGRADAVEEVIAPTDQYACQGETFSRLIREGGSPAFPLEDSVANMKVLDALFRSERSGGWETV